jgi:hypothetical protein
MTRTDIENQIRETEWPAASAALRSRVLAAAPAAPQVTWSDRVWFSRIFRWSVAAAVVTLIAVGQGSGSNWAGSATAAADTVQALAIEAGLPADAASSLARRLTAARVPLSSSARTMALQQLMSTDGGH